MTELGTVLDGKYEILKKVGQGGMSIVYLAMDNRLNKQWAVKEIKNDGSKSVETLLKGLEREANILKNVDHPVLPRIVDIINENGTIYVIMDFVEGKPLNEVLKAEGAQKLLGGVHLHTLCLTFLLEIHDYINRSILIYDYQQFGAIPG